MRPPLAFVASLLVGVGAEAAVRQDTQISPEVDQHDKKFFKKDYPWDKRPVADRHYVFDHPYPAVQDTGDYDRDFVKDENADGGKWKAQMEYDVLRSKIRAAETKLEAAKEKLDKEEGEWRSAEDRYAKTSSEEHSAEAMRQKAEQEAAAAEAKVNRLEGGSSKKGTKVGGAVGDAVEKVNKEMDDLENCKKELATAKKKLKELIKEKEELDKKAKDDEETRKKEVVEVKKKVEAVKKEKQVKREEAEKVVKVKTVDESMWKKKLAEETEEHAQATKSYEEELNDVKRTEAELKAAEQNLRKYRRPPYVDGDGGVYNVPGEKGSAMQSSVVMAILLTVISTVAM